MRFPVIARQNTPPASPSMGQRWIVGASPSGAWTGHSHKLAVWRGTWKFIQPVKGDRTYDQDAEEFVLFDGNNWIADPRGKNPMTYLADGVIGTLMSRAGLTWAQQGTGDDEVVETVLTTPPRPYWWLEIPHPGNGGDTSALKTRREWDIQGGALGDTEAVEFAFITMNFSPSNAVDRTASGVYVRRDSTSQGVVIVNRSNNDTARITRRGSFTLTSYGNQEGGSDLFYPNNRQQFVTLVRFRRNGNNIELWWSLEGAVWILAWTTAMTNSAVDRCGVVIWRTANEHSSILVLGCRRVSMP